MPHPCQGPTNCCTTGYDPLTLHVRETWECDRMVLMSKLDSVEEKESQFLPQGTMPGSQQPGAGPRAAFRGWHDMRRPRDQT